MQWFSLCYHFMELSHKIDVLKNIFYKNRYPLYFVEKVIKDFYRALTPKIAVSIVSIKYLIKFLPYLGKLLLQSHITINPMAKNKRPYCNLWLVLQTKSKLVNFLTLKDKIRVFLHYGIVYKIKCVCCHATYYDKSICYFKTSRYEHLGVSSFLWKTVDGAMLLPLRSIIYSTIFNWFWHFSLLAISSNNYKIIKGPICHFSLFTCIFSIIFLLY